MGWFHSNSNDAHDAVYGGKQHKSSFTHELIGGAAGYEAMRAYEKHCEANGAPPSHDQAKALLAGFAAAEVDKLFETKGLDEFDREKAKRQAVEQAHAMYGQQYM